MADAAAVATDPLADAAVATDLLADVAMAPDPLADAAAGMPDPLADVAAVAPNLLAAAAAPNLPPGGGGGGGVVIPMVRRRRPRRADARAAGGEEDEATKEPMAPQEPDGESECTGAAKRWKAAAAATNVSMELGILDCPVCNYPLRPPIFQCAVGHVVCSSCCSRLPDKCHRCFITTGYNRCYIIEHVVDSTKVPCMYSNLGCTEKITYYEKEDHAKVCPHAPCFCPEANCTFYGSTVELFEHFSDKHKWDSAKLSYNKAFQFSIAQGSTVLLGDDGHIFLVNMVQVEAVGCVISVFSIQPHISESNFTCKLAVSCPEKSYIQCTQFQTRSSNLHDGLPKDCFTFVVPKLLLRGTGKNVRAMVSVTLIPP